MKTYKIIMFLKQKNLNFLKLFDLPLSWNIGIENPNIIPFKAILVMPFRHKLNKNENMLEFVG